MRLDENRVTRRFLDIDLTIPARWMITLIVLGLINAGMMWQQFSDAKDQISEIKMLLRNAADNNSIAMQRNLLQDNRLDEHERRLNKHDDMFEGRSIRRRQGAWHESDAGVPYYMLDPSSPYLSVRLRELRIGSPRLHTCPIEDYSGHWSEQLARSPRLVLERRS